MKFTESLKKNRDFQFVYQNGKSCANRLLILYVFRRASYAGGKEALPSSFRKMKDGQNRLGVSVSRKVGNSVVRHHLCRLIRESYRLHEEEFVGGLDVIVIARPGAKESNFFDIERALLHAGKIAGIRTAQSLAAEKQKKHAE